MVGYGWIWLEIVGYGWKWLEMDLKINKLVNLW
jgi:hypothetical protein